MPTAKLRERKWVRSTIGRFSVISQMTHEMKPIRDTIARPMIAGEENQSASLPWSSMICRADTQTMSRPSPTPSTGILRPGVSRPFSPRAQPNAQRMPIGTLMKKIHDQVALSEIQPPSSGPQTGAAMVVIDQMALAVAAWRWGKMARSSASEPGIMGPETPP